jgi:hypothetical protein
MKDISGEISKRIMWLRFTKDFQHYPKSLFLGLVIDISRVQTSLTPGIITWHKFISRL